MTINNLTIFGRQIALRGERLAGDAVQMRLVDISVQLSSLARDATVEREAAGNRVTLRGRDVAQRFFDDERFHLIGRG